MGPVIGPDGVCRLTQVESWQELSPAAIPLIPPKKTLLPPEDPLWTLAGGEYRSPPPPEQVVLMGIPPCDLYGLAYLDLVFADDPLYRRRRENLLVAGAVCTPALRPLSGRRPDLERLSGRGRDSGHHVERPRQSGMENAI